MKMEMEFLAAVSYVFTSSLMLLLNLPQCQTELREYCFPNVFNATCGPDAVIVITSARYGRMNKGKCLTSDYHVGCWADVLHHVDRKCSGRHHCLITIPDNTLHHLQPCPKDLLAYLETDYTCQKVEGKSSTSSCRHYGDLVVDARSGYMASIVTEEHGYGSARCPWVINVPRGQRINITLVDFGVAFRFDDVGSMCHVYAKISETGMASEITVCGSRTRQRSVYISESNRLEVVVMSFKLEDEPIYFLLKYEAIGCTDPIVPRGAWMKRTGEKAVVTCNFTSQTWHIVCQGSGWFGKVDNCSTDAVMPKTSTLSFTVRDRFPYGLPVAVITGLVVGVLLGVAMLAVVIACLKRRNNPALSARDFFTGSTMMSAVQGGSPFIAKKDQQQLSNTEYGYTHICGIAHSANYLQSDVNPGGHVLRSEERRNAELQQQQQLQQSNQQRLYDQSGITVEYRLDCRHVDRPPCCHELETLAGDGEENYNWHGASV